MALTIRDATTFTAELGEEDIPITNVIGGDDPSKFVPNINMSRWSDEYWLNLNIPVVIGAGAVLEVTSAPHWFHGPRPRVELTQGDWRFFAFDLDGTVLEAGVEFSSRPASNEVVWDVGAASDLVWFRQSDTREPEHPGETITTLDRVLGSYALYTPRRNLMGTKYRTGKFAHAYRWEVVDSVGARDWCVMVYDAGVLRVQMPSDWLDKAVYPVIAMGSGDTFGNTTIQSSTASLATGFYFGDKGTPSSSGTLDDFQWHANDIENVTCGLYSSDGATLHDNSNEVTTSFGAGWKDISAGWAGYSVVGSTQYLLANSCDASRVMFYDNTSPNTTWYLGSQTYSAGSMNSDISSYTDYGNRYMSIYANYTPSGGDTSSRLTLLGVG